MACLTAGMVGCGGGPGILFFPSRGLEAAASVTETNDWQFAVFPSEDAYCGATPTERSPFFGRQVSSMTRKASSPPTSLSASVRSATSRGALSHTPVGDEVMQLIIADCPIPRSHWLHAPAVARADQSRDINRTHPTPCLVPERRDKRRQPTFQIAPPGSHKPPASLNAGSL